MAITIINFFLVILATIILFNFGGYTALLKIISAFRKIDHTIDDEFFPSVTLLIAAYNEADIIKEKIENSLALRYPSGLLKIIVVSDGSTDATNEITNQFKHAGVQLIADTSNQGKATALNTGMDEITSEIVVLSDANVMYQTNAVLKLVRHFSDEKIGAVSGKVILVNEGLSYSNSENTYYSVEHQIQQLESDTGNLIGADGALYALRRELFRPLQKDTLLDDLVLSMGVIQQGKRLLFDAEALGYENNLTEMESEYTRKVRIIAGGIQCLKRKTIWPPNSHPLTAAKLTCHKIMRWIIGPVFILFVALLLLRGILIHDKTSLFLSTTTLLGLIALQILPRLFPTVLESKAINMLNYVLIMIKASVVGCYKGLATNQKVSWR